jgi:hypothetical protein
VNVGDGDKLAMREEMFMLPGLSFSGFSIPLRDRRWSIDQT